MTTSTLIVLDLAVLILFFTIRFHWIAYRLRRYSVEMSWWTARTKQPAEVVQYVSAIWSFWHIYLRFWLWNWRAFVVYPEVYDEAQAWMKGQLARKDLDWVTFQLELAEAQKGESETGEPTQAPTQAPEQNT